MARTILLADDSMTIQKVVELTFMDEDYQVVAVSDGSAAIEKLSEMQPDLLIADVHMPGAGGYDVCRHAKSNRPGLPVLLLVGTFEQFDEGEAQACGADGHLKKPFDSQELLSRVESLIQSSAAPAAPTLVAPAPTVMPSAMPQAERVPAMPSAPAAPEPPSAPPFVPEATTAPTAPAVTVPAVESPAQTVPMEEPASASAVSDTADTRPMASRSPSAESDGGLSDGDVDRIARRVVELLGDKVLREVSWEVVPDLAEVVIRERIQELERQVESA